MATSAEGAPHAEGETTPNLSDSTDSSKERLGRLFQERDRVNRLSRVRQLVFGSLDGLLVPLGVVSGVAGGTGDARAVIVAGLAEAFAGALSMGAGEYISGRSEAQVQRAEIVKEDEGIRREPEYELREMALLLEHEGLSSEDAAQVAQTLARAPEAFRNTMIQKELGLQTDVSTVRVAEGLTMGISYIIGSIFPLIAYFFLPVKYAFFASLALTLVALIAVGVLRGRLTSLNIFTSSLEIVVVGAVSAGGGYLLGVIVPHLLGF